MNGCARADGVDAGLLGGVHQVVELALQRREGAVDRQGAGDVGGVEVVALDAHVEQHQLAAALIGPVLSIQCSVVAWEPPPTIES